MWTNVNDKFFTKYNKYSTFISKRLLFNSFKDMSSIKKNIKNIIIDDPNSYIRLTPKTKKKNLTTNNYTNFKNCFILDEKWNISKKRKKKCITKIFSDEELMAYKYDSSNKIKLSKNIVKKSNKKFKKKEYKGNTFKNKQFSKNENRLKQNKLTKNHSNKKLQKLNINHSDNDFNIYNYYSKMKINNISKTSRSIDSSNSNTIKFKNIMYKLNKNIFINSHKSYNNIKSINNKKENKNLKVFKNDYFCNSINYHTSSNNKTSFNAYMKNYLPLFGNFSKYKLTKIGKNIYNKKIEFLTEFNTNNTTINKQKEEKFNATSKSKNTILNNKKKKSEIISFLDLLKNKNYKNINDSNLKSNDNSKKSNKSNNNYIKKNSITNREKKKKKYKTGNNSRENVKVYKIENLFKSCNIPHLKKKKHLSKILPLELDDGSKNLKCKFKTNFINNTDSRKDIELYKNFNNSINKIKNKKKISDIYFHAFTEGNLYDNIFESDNEDNKELINEIKINKFDINKPNEQNMKYTNVKESIEEEKEESNKQLHLSRIIIGEIDEYKDIIEKDRINDLLIKNKKKIYFKKDDYNKKIKKEKEMQFNDSETEKSIIKMINLENDMDYISTNDFNKNNVKESKKTKKYNITFDINNLSQNENIDNKKEYNSSIKNKFNNRKDLNSLIIKKSNKKNKIIDNKKNNKFENKVSSLNKLIIKKKNIIYNENNNNTKKKKLKKNIKVK